MLLVETRIEPSEIHGLGLFAAHPIREGTPTWRFHPGIDVRLSDEALAALPAPVRRQFMRYTYRCPETGDYVLCSDDARYFNHSDDPNTVSIRTPDGEAIDVAARDIAAGEELTCDYRRFDADWGSKVGPARGVRVAEGVGVG